MPEPLKNIYSKTFIDDFTMKLKKVYPALDTDRFTKYIFDKHWSQKELKQRMRHIAEVMGQLLPQSFPEAADIIVRCTKEAQSSYGEGMNFPYMFFPDFIEIYGLDHFEVSIKAFERITQFTSAEFAVRPFLIRYPEKMQRQMLAWSNHEHPMVRRLSSEGFRPRLPWAMAVPYLKKDPSVILPVLENLKNDSSENVRRSVANNLNDIAKDHPALVLKIAAAWQGKSPETDWVIRHGSRTLLKRGHQDTLKHFGLTETKGISVDNLKTDKKKIRIGDSLLFSFQLTLKKPAKLRVEYGIDFIKANGKSSRKIFKLKEGGFEKGTYDLSRKQSFKDFTTRKHYPGIHKINIIVNGQEKASIGFTLLK